MGSLDAGEMSMDHQRQDPLIGQVLDGRYRIETVLGEGGMGLVYKAMHATLRKPLAIKVLRPEVSKNEEIVARFKQEAQSASRSATSTSSTSATSARCADGSTYFVMEFLDGRSLTTALESKTASTPQRTHPHRQAAVPARSAPRTRSASSTATSSRTTCS